MDATQRADTAPLFATGDRRHPDQTMSTILPTDMSMRERLVALYVYYNGPSSASDIADTVGLAVQEVQSAISVLSKEGVITDYDGRYALRDDPQGYCDF